MFEAAKEFITQLSTGDVWYGFIGLSIFYILKKEPLKIVAHYSDRKDKDIELAKKLLDSDKFTKETQALLRERIEQEVFRKYYGINTSEEMRVALLKLYQLNQNVVGWHDLKRAFPNLSLEGKRIKVSLKASDHFFRWSVLILSKLTAAYALFLLSVGTFLRAIGNIQDLQFFGWTLASLLLLVLAITFSTLNWQFDSAIKIRNLTDGNENAAQGRTATDL